jgi:hypothetical protein
MIIADFMPEFDIDCKLEGWAIFNADGRLRIQALDDPKMVEYDMKQAGIFPPGHKIKHWKGIHPDVDVIKYCTIKALSGSKLHLLALFLDGQDAESEFEIPKEMVSG